MPVLPKAIFRCNGIPLKSLMSFFTEIEKTILKFRWNHKMSWTDKETVDKMNSSGGIPIFDSKLYYRGSVNKVLWHWYQNRNQRDGIEYRIQLQSGFPDFFFWKDTKLCLLGKSCFREPCWENCTPTPSTVELNPLFPPCRKVKST